MRMWEYGNENDGDVDNIRAGSDIKFKVPNIAMKRLFILIISVLPGIHLSAQTLFTYGKHKVDKEEFLKAFYKNNTGITMKRL